MDIQGGPGTGEEGLGGQVWFGWRDSVGSFQVWVGRDCLGRGVDGYARCG